jgi:Lrp/AsnC family transcriptional regulator for asnA, asnC and gidA
MQIVAVTDPVQVGFSRQAMVGLRVEGDVTAVAEQAAALREVDYVVVTAGSFDLMVEVVCEDDDHLLDLVSRRLRALPGVRTTETFVYLKLRKQRYDWGTR